MSGDDKRVCSESSADDLLLYAYGDEKDERLEAHIKECEACRAYLSELDGVRKLASEAGLVSAGDEAVAGIMAEARKRAASGKAAPSGRKAGGLLSWLTFKPWSESFIPAWLRAPALAAAAIVMILGVLVLWGPWRENGRVDVAGPEPTGEVPVYLADISNDLTELEEAIEFWGGSVVETHDIDSLSLVSGPADEEALSGIDEVLDDESGAWEVVFESDGELDDLDSIELAMLDLEYSMGTLDVLSDFQEATLDYGEGPGAAGDEFDEFDLPLLPGLESGRSL